MWFERYAGWTTRAIVPGCMSQRIARRRILEARAGHRCVCAGLIRVWKVGVWSVAQPTALMKLRQAEASRRSDQMVWVVRKPERSRGRRIW